MKALTINDVNSLIEQSALKKRLKSSLRPATIIANLSSDDWDNLDMLAIPSKDSRNGILLLGIDQKVFLTAYELSRITANSQNGRLKPVICDLCKSWQAGGRAAIINYRLEARSLNTIGFLCCVDLNCSLNVRDLTSEARVSRSQLREDITREARIHRLHNSLRGLINALNLEAL